ncbi:cupin domain-containing protein [soil metagenome]
MPTNVDVPFTKSADVDWHVMAEGVRRQVLGHGTDLMIVRVEFKAGAVGALHHHPHRQASYVQSGRFNVTVGSDISELVAGDCFYAPADIPHSVQAIEEGVLIDVFTPIRQDFLQPAT